MKKVVAIVLHDDPSDGVEKCWVGDSEKEVISRVFGYVGSCYEKSGDPEEAIIAKEYYSKSPTQGNWEGLQMSWTGENDVYLFHLFEIEV